VKQLRGVGGVAIEIGDEFADDGIDVRQFEPAGESEVRLLRGVSIGSVGDGEGEIEVAFGDEREESVVLGGEDGSGGGVGEESEHGWAGGKAERQGTRHQAPGIRGCGVGRGGGVRGRREQERGQEGESGS
jgi:hypothetical protein